MIIHTPISVKLQTTTPQLAELLAAEIIKSGHECEIINGSVLSIKPKAKNEPQVVKVEISKSEHVEIRWTHRGNIFNQLSNYILLWKRKATLLLRRARCSSN